MSLSWNEVRDRAIRFARDWSASTAEERDKQSFWNAFFDVFGVPRRSVATFEHAVANVRSSYGFLDLFWPGVLLVEHKSRGASLAKAESQAFAYLHDLMRQGQHNAVPRYIVLCDFARFALYDLEPEDNTGLPVFAEGRAYRLTEFPLADLHRHARDFAFVKGEKSVRLDPEDPANLKATQLLADLHDELEATGYSGHALERTLVRLLFCLFAEDSGIFEPGAFTALVNASAHDGRLLGANLTHLWDVLNTPEERRQRTLDEDLAAFPYVNGGLFAESLPIASYSEGHRAALVACTRFHWARISPAVFGSLFQGVMDGKERRQLGAHYTSERDILKQLRALFLDDLRAELDAAKADRSTGRAARLREFQQKLRRLRVFDPACGCGNFLILGYRELRRLETEALITLHTREGQVQGELDVRALAFVDVDQFYGIEIGEWPARIAEVGLWLQDHQCNVELAEALGRAYRRLPLRATPTLRVANALRTDWREVLPPGNDVLVVGNPPFVGKHYQSAEQKADLRLVFGDFGNVGDLDYVTAWYVKAGDYVQGHHALRCAFVSTNSICQGEQVPVLWGLLFQRYHLKIQFAHRTFGWTSEAKGKAHVHVVIVGFGLRNPAVKRLYDYADGSDEATVTEVANISPYLTPGPDTFVTKQRKPLCPVPEMGCGCKPSDGGHLLLDIVRRDQLIDAHPEARDLLRRFVGSDDLINGYERWCLWLTDANWHDWKNLAKVRERIAAVREFRAKSTAAPTRNAALSPSQFFFLNAPTAPYIAMPEVSSERRRYIPIAILPANVVPSNKLYVIHSRDHYLFGVLSSLMHMAWVKLVSGRLESRFQYSASMVYNTFPWPDDATEKQQNAVREAADRILELRIELGDGRLATSARARSTPPAPPWPTSTTRRVCRPPCSRPTPTSTARWTVVTAPNPLPATESASNTSSPSTKTSPPPSPPPLPRRSQSAPASPTPDASPPLAPVHLGKCPPKIENAGDAVFADAPECRWFVTCRQFAHPWIGLDDATRLLLATDSIQTEQNKNMRPRLLQLAQKKRRAGRVVIPAHQQPT
jgi:hypothetical protein